MKKFFWFIFCLIKWILIFGVVIGLIGLISIIPAAIAGGFGDTFAMILKIIGWGVVIGLLLACVIDDWRHRK